MSRIRNLAVIVVLFGAVLVANSASAQSMNLALQRLRLQSSTGACGPDFPGQYCADNNAWRGVAQQFGVALGAATLSPAATTGPRGFYIGLESSITGISSGAGFWHAGSRGDTQSVAGGVNNSPAGQLMWERLQIRKGLPFGFELGGSVGYLFGTSYWSLGADLKIAIFEGFRHSWGTFVPDIAFRGSVQTLLGDSAANITTPSLEIIASKPLTIGGVGTISPYVGAQLMWIVASSGVVDLTPNVDAFVTSSDAYNNAVFARLTTMRTRGFIGAQGRYRQLIFSASVNVDLAKPSDAGATFSLGLPRQWAGNFAIGLQF